MCNFLSDLAMVWPLSCQLLAGDSRGREIYTTPEKKMSQDVL